MIRQLVPLTLILGALNAAAVGDPIACFEFDGNFQRSGGPGPAHEWQGCEFVEGVEGKALRLHGDRTDGGFQPAEDLIVGPKDDFSVQFWVRSESSDPAVLLSNKTYADRSLDSQKAAGWVFYQANGTWAWNIGSGGRRVTYERDNGERMPLNDGKWHQLTMTYGSANAEVRIYYDGWNAATYCLGDSKGFDFSSKSPLTLGSAVRPDGQDEILPAIEEGARRLTELVEAFNAVSPGPVVAGELIDLVVGPEDLLAKKGGKEGADLKSVDGLRGGLMKNPFTVYQVRDFMKVSLLARLYQIDGDQVVVRREAALEATLAERLVGADAALDKLTVWRRALSASEVKASWEKHGGPGKEKPPMGGSKLTSAVWNIHHGGKHQTIGKDGWDSRLRIVEMLKSTGADVVMMQETYSSGDFIAAELGFHFATTCDWDYLNQGSNISVMSRYPIEEIRVPAEGSFMNVAVRVRLSPERDVWVMSNWYGMNQFPHVFDSHAARFSQSAKVPVLFGGDFNAVPHTDGGKSPASRKMLEEGFTDAYRVLNPDVGSHPGHTHRSGSRIDQLYFKGKFLKHESTEVISRWKGGFPSDHYLILSRFGIR